MRRPSIDAVKHLKLFFHLVFNGSTFSWTVSLHCLLWVATLLTPFVPAVRAVQKPAIQEVLPKAGLVVSEKGNLTEILCKPKIMQLKSITLQKLEEMEVFQQTAPCCLSIPIFADFE